MQKTATSGRKKCAGKEEGRKEGGGTITVSSAHRPLGRNFTRGRFETAERHAESGGCTGNKMRSAPTAEDGRAESGKGPKPEELIWGVYPIQV